MRCIVVLFVVFFSAIANVASAKPYKGAEIYSNQSYLYGRFEIRMRVANASGVLSTFFTYKNGSEVGNTFWEEIDIEVFGKNNATQWQTNIILGSSRPTIHTEQVHTADTSLADAYHTYVLEWTPDYVAWYLDGVEVRRITGTSTVTSLTNAQSLRFNLWASESVPWVGSWDDTELPVYQFINYIDYKTYNTTTKNFEGGWRDDFNSFDSTRWGKANWTFDTNRIDFLPDNVVVKDGILVLALTHENATGFTGEVPLDEIASSSSSSSAAVSSISASSASSELVNQSSASSQASEAAVSSEASSVMSSATSARKSGSGGGAMDWCWLLVLGGLAARVALKWVFLFQFFPVIRR